MTTVRRLAVISGQLRPCPAAGVRMSGMKEMTRRLEALSKYAATAPAKITALQAQADGAPTPTVQPSYDVLVLGFGCAGTAAALSAAESGKRVLIADRFEAGGSCRRSGGVYYAGGGTRAQKAADVHDTVLNMFNYIKYENGGAIDDVTIRSFCDASAENFGWLEAHGVCFEDGDGHTRYYERKTSYPPSYSTLYQSGNEAAAPWNKHAEPAARGHRAFGDYLTGHSFFDPLRDRVQDHPLIDVITVAPATELARSPGGACNGAVISILPACDQLRTLMAMLFETATSSTMIQPSRAIERSCLESIKRIELEFGRKVHIEASATIIATGGFFYNDQMVEKYAPSYSGFMPLGNLGDDGAGINMGMAVGGQVDRMDRCSAWKFTNPAYAFIEGVLVNQYGQRAGNEDVYGATLADYLVQKHDGKGWLVIDSRLFEKAQTQAMGKHSDDSEEVLQEDQKMQTLINLFKNNVQGETVGELEEAMQVPTGALAATLDKYNKDAKLGIDTMFGKAARYLSPLEEGPFYALNLQMTGNKWWPTPCMSLGGLVVEGASGRVLDCDAQPISGLYAAGRSAVGVASNYYVSGLSLADGVWSGRRAGNHAAVSTRL